MRARQAACEAVRAAELAEAQRLEAEVARKAAERRRRAEQEAARLAREAQVQRRVCAAERARALVRAGHAAAHARLTQAGYWYDPVRREVETAVLPALRAALAAAVALREDVATPLLDDLVRAALEKRAAHAAAARARAAAAAAALAALAADEAEAAARAAAASRVDEDLEAVAAAAAAADAAPESAT